MLNINTRLFNDRKTLKKKVSNTFTEDRNIYWVNNFHDIEAYFE